MNQVSFKRLSDADLDRLEKEGGELVVVRDGHEPMVVMRLADWQAMDDTTYLLSDPANREMLLRSIAELDAGKGVERELINP
ncbi:type II toxin-antitoxin system Phd/YefM family antitoxin [Aquibium sp. ELW1220]|uniref:type II toxin-antitoxin system Phd/YefM family antitoxin n=1 Tax=Aquibium sp. ELW1220 TaxID=2976766 RepID=UPI0025B1285B|nr:type II toxin-antitoxin system Phd/YefM family antitoxin [Aquibium sp. ELW1220]MDN2582752.1 type II toxin-antitoxin system Phd/YefM family antitoxin [Aquibium sp. ELW1220]